MSTVMRKAHSAVYAALTAEPVIAQATDATIDVALHTDADSILCVPYLPSVAPGNGAGTRGGSGQWQGEVAVFLYQRGPVSPDESDSAIDAIAGRLDALADTQSTAGVVFGRWSLSADTAYFSDGIVAHRFTIPYTAIR